MKRNVGTTAVLFLIVLGLVVVPAAPAQVATYSVEGIVYAINTDENSIQVDEGDNITSVYCVPFNFLAKRGLVLDVGTAVSIEVYDRTFSDGTVKLIAVGITVEEKTYELPGRNPNRL